MWEANGQPITIRAAIRWAIYYLTKCATTLVACRLYVDVGDPKVDVLEKVLGHGHGPCYDLKYFTWFKYKFKLAYISSWASFSCKLVFNDEFYQRFVSFGIKANNHVLGT
jgi:hypothetical protein